MSDEYDVIVIGAGPVGENAADYAVRGTDFTAALVEQELIGGECSYFACIPSKALLRPVAVAAVTNDLRGVRPTSIDVEAMLARRDYWVSNYDDSGQVRWAESAGIHDHSRHGTCHRRASGHCGRPDAHRPARRGGGNGQPPRDSDRAGGRAAVDES